MKGIVATLALIGAIVSAGAANGGEPAKTAPPAALAVPPSHQQTFGTAIDILAQQHLAQNNAGSDAPFGDATDNGAVLDPGVLGNSADTLMTSQDPLDFRLPPSVGGIVDDAGVNFSGYYARWRELTRTDEPTALAIIVAGVVLMIYLIVRRRRRAGRQRR